MATPSPEVKSAETKETKETIPATPEIIMNAESTKSQYKEYVEHLSEDERTLFQDEFNTYDKTGNGFITSKVGCTRSGGNTSQPTKRSHPSRHRVNKAHTNSHSGPSH